MMIQFYPWRGLSLREMKVLSLEDTCSYGENVEKRRRAAAGLSPDILSEKVAKPSDQSTVSTWQHKKPWWSRNILRGEFSFSLFAFESKLRFFLSQLL